jgi:hypothetical protein
MLMGKTLPPILNIDITRVVALAFDFVSGWWYCARVSIAQSLIGALLMDSVCTTLNLAHDL